MQQSPISFLSLSTIFLSEKNITLSYNNGAFVLDKTIYNSFPIGLYNTGNSEVTVTLQFSSNITDVNCYFIIMSNNIVIDGDNKSCTIDVANYPGLVKNNSYTFKIQNLKIYPSTKGSIAEGQSWLCQKDTHNTTIYNCGCAGSISNTGGGLLGSNSDCCIAQNCFSTGKIGISSGGIVGANANKIKIINCFSTGSICDTGGGIIGRGSVNSDVIGSYSLGQIEFASGGIIGADSNHPRVYNCYSAGNLQYDNSGGIIGDNCDNIENIQNCYTIGNAIDNFKKNAIGGIISNQIADPISCYSELSHGSFGWHDDIAKDILGSMWISLQPNTPYLCSTFNTPIYNVNFFVLTNDCPIIMGREDGLMHKIISVNDRCNFSDIIMINDITGTINCSLMTSGTYQVVVYKQCIDGSYTFNQISLDITTNLNSDGVRLIAFRDNSFNVNNYLCKLKTSKHVKSLKYQGTKLTKTQYLHTISWIHNDVLFILKCHVDC